jgi:hypothetical protein
MHPMSRAWLNLQGPDAPPGGARFDLKPGLTMLGGARGDVPVAGSGSDCVHVWSTPPKVVFVGAGEPPRVNGQAAMEMALADGDRLEWRGLVATFGFDDGQARLEEVAAASPAPAAPFSPGAPGLAPPLSAPLRSASVAPGAPVAPSAPLASGESGARSTVEPAGFAGAASALPDGPWRHLKAGLLAEMALGEPAVVKRWQEAVARGEFDADAAARDLLASAPGLADGDRRLADRSTRLMRDLLMSSVTRNPMRKVRKAARNSLAFLLVQTFILVLFTLLVLCGLLLVHTRFGYSIDAFLEGILDLF